MLEFSDKSLISIAVFLLAGVGLFLTGIKMLSANVKNVVGRRFKSFTRVMTKNPLCGVLWGVSLGFVSQSSRTLAMLFSSIVSVGLIRPGQVLVFITFSNIGTLLIIGIAMSPMDYIALILTGAAGFAYSISKPRSFEGVYSAMLAAAVTLLGLVMITSAAKTFMTFPQIYEVLRAGNQMPLFAFLAGALLVVLTQSYPAMMLLAISMSTSGVGWATSMSFAMGAHLGSSFNAYLFALGFPGAARRVVLYVVYYYYVVVGVFYGGLLVANISGVSGYISGIWSAAGYSSQTATATAIVAANLAACAAIMLFSKQCRNIVAKLSPESQAERDERPEFIDLAGENDHSIDIELANKEQLRLVRRLPSMVADVRRRISEKIPLDELGASPVEDVLHNYINSMMNTNLDAVATEQILNLKERNYTLKLAEQTLLDLGRKLEQFHRGPSAEFERLFDALKEVSSAFVEVCANPKLGDIVKFCAFCTEMGRQVEDFRRKFSAQSAGLPAEEEEAASKIANLFDRYVWLLNRYAGSLSGG